MDLGAYAEIERWEKIAKDNGIYVPRLRGYRLMSDEIPFSNDRVIEIAMDAATGVCDNIVRTGCSYCWEGSPAADRRARKYLVHDGYKTPTDIKWSAVHGKLRRQLKFEVKKAVKLAKKQYDAWNRYCGRSDVLFIHARIGGENWPYYRKVVVNQPWFIEKVDDTCDSTYCDIYARIEPERSDDETN